MDGTSANSRSSVGRQLERTMPSLHRRPTPYPFLSPPLADDEIGRLGAYRVLRLLGEGGMGMVFEAEDTGLCRPVALKVTKQVGGAHGEEASQRFLREARSMAAIKHDNLLTVYQVGEEAGTIYMAMELLRGETLEARIRRRQPFRPADVCRIGREIATGLAAIHLHGLVHRDIKPGNLWLEEYTDRVKILDFGLARTTKEDSKLTRDGMVVGTPAYLSPEQARGLSVDTRSDLFSLGCVLYRLCTGSLPFHADDTVGLLIAVTTEDPSPVGSANSEIPGPLAALVHKLLAKDAAHRPSSAAAVADAIWEIEQPPPPPTRKVTRVVALPATPPPAPAPETVVEPTRRTRTRPRRSARRSARKRAWVAPVCWVVGAVVLLGFVTGIAVALRKPSSPQTTDSSVASATPAPPLKPPPSGPKASPPGSTSTPPVPLAPVKVFLTDLEVVAAVGWPFDPAKHGPPGLPPRHPGAPPGGGGWQIVVNGIESPKGIFLHASFAPNPPARVSYSLGKKYKVFTSRVSINDSSPGSRSPMTFDLWGDGQILWTSLPVSTKRDEQTCSCSVEGVDVLMLRVTATGDAGGAHGVWIEPVLTK